MARTDGRKLNELRNIAFLQPFQKFVPGSVIIQTGNTIVNCSAGLEDKVPPFLNPETDGWLTCEYSMLPGSSPSRVQREASKGKQTGRTMEIQRLIGRSLRSVLNLKKIPGKTLWIDCDVIQADGGTRTASITGASVAMNIAFKKLLLEGIIKANPMTENVAAVSLGIVGGEIMADLNYGEDSSADADMNLVMTQSGKFVELQISSEKNTFTDEELNSLLSLGKTSISQLSGHQAVYLVKSK